MDYDFAKVEKKWQDRWDEKKVFVASEDRTKKKFYALVEFPYPSGAGMHVGHIKAYGGLEVIARKKRMEGYNVLFPIGFDAFGLPTENYAIKTGIHPRKVTDTNIERFTDQLKKVGFSFDWTKVIDTTDENYYKWTQWIFLKMFEHGLAFRDKTLVNYCPSCKVVLSNEDSQGGAVGAAIKKAVSQGAKRGLFSNEAGMGSTPHAHALAQVKRPHEQGVVAMIGVFIDTFVVLTMTALVVITTLYTGNGILSSEIAPAGIDKTNMAQIAFGEIFGRDIGQIFVAICLFFFAFSTILSWNLFGRINMTYLFGKKSNLIYSILAMAFIVVGSCLSNDLVWELTDFFNYLMVLPNVIALIALSSYVAKESRKPGKALKNKSEKTEKETVSAVE